jgi:Domain of unknown function (DUF4185)
MMTPSRREFLKMTAASVLTAGRSRVRATAAQPAASSASTDESPVSAVRYLGKQFLNNPVGVTGADGATSLVLPSGQSLWVFGDTVEGPFETIRGLNLTPFNSNTGALVPRQELSSGIKEFRFLATVDGKRPRQLVPFAPEEDPSRHRVWAIHGLCVDKTVYLYYHRITLLKDVDVFVNFKLDGMGVARAAVGKLEFARLTAPDGTREFWKGDQPSFGVFVERADEFIYLWGSLMTGMYLTRTRPDTIEDLTSYEYLVTAPTEDQPGMVPRWSKSFTSTAPLFDSVPNEMSAAYNHHLGKYVAIHSLHRENKIVMRTAPRIIGPWGEPQVVYQPEQVKDSDLVYAAKEHPELAREGGRVIYVTFVNSESYVPQMIEITLK